MTMVANYSTLAADLYVVYAGKEPDTQHPIFKVFLNPLVAWVWIGMGIVILGSASSLLARQAKTSGTQEGNFWRLSPSVRKKSEACHNHDSIMEEIK